MEYQHYFLASSQFCVDVSSFGIHQIKPVFDDRGTDFVREEQAYGIVELVYQKGGEQKTFSPHDPLTLPQSRSTKYHRVVGERENPIRQTEGIFQKYGTRCQVEYRYGNGDVSAVMHYRLKGDYLEQSFTIKNESEEAIEILDLSVFLPSNSNFSWDEYSGNKVINHNFFGGHGSFVLTKRCDDVGPSLLMMAQGETKFEYFEGKAGFYAFHDELDGVYAENNVETYPNAFIYSKNACKRALEKGTNLRHPNTSKILLPDGEVTHTLRFVWCRSDEEAREKLFRNGLLDILSLPGYTLPRDLTAKLAIRGNYGDIVLKPEYPEQTSLERFGRNGEYELYEVKFRRLGENKLTAWYDGGSKWTDIEYFITEPLETLIEKRGEFLAEHQCRDKDKWFRGLLCEWNSETQKPVTPDELDGLTGWRVFAASCDDPGAAKPSYLSSKVAEYPTQRHVDAMDDYIEYFLWGGHQRTEDEEYPYGVYGTPDWHAHRTSSDPGPGRVNYGSQLHIWRVYDYPHVILTYYNMYRVASSYPQVRTRLTAEEYLKRAYKTAIAMFTYPMGTDGWNPDTLGLYNELCIPDIIDALFQNGFDEWARHLTYQWTRKTKYFVLHLEDLYTSEIPMDTTDFETSHAVAKYALDHSEVHTAFTAHPRDVYYRRNPIFYNQAMEFMQKQLHCNLSCRGTIEPAYYWYGSDYRGRNISFTLTYMSQMGGWAVLDYALYYAENPFELLRIGYGSVLSAWALVNTGDEESNYGYWFPGKANDGAAGGGFEAMPFGYTWLMQPHHRGCWYYSGETDLGLSGSLRALATVAADDPIFGRIVYGGTFTAQGNTLSITPMDGVRRRFHIIRDGWKFHFVMSHGKLSKQAPILVNLDSGKIELDLDCTEVVGTKIRLDISVDGEETFEVLLDGEPWQEFSALEQKMLLLLAEKERYRLTLVGKPI